MNQHLFHRSTPAPHISAGQHLRELRRQANLSQLELALLTGLSQRHLSCVETGRAKASQARCMPSSRPWMRRWSGATKCSLLQDTHPATPPRRSMRLNWPW